VLTSADPAAAAEFYCALFGWTAEPSDDGGTTFLLRGLAVAGLVPSSSGRSAWLTYISTDDTDATVTRVADAGGALLQPPADQAGRARTALCTDPAGGVFGVWQRGRFAGAQVVNEPGAICWSETVTRNVPAAVDFYGKVFGWTEQAGTAVAEYEYREWLSTNRVVGGLSRMSAQYPPETPQHWRTIFTIDDCAGFVARAGELGGHVLAGPIDAGIGFACQVMDPTGGTFLAIELLPELRDLLD